jgi:Mrp family chromosome partitioning ATPase
MLLGPSLADFMAGGHCAVNHNLFFQASAVHRTAREQMNGHRALVIWLTGLSGAGKSTIAFALEAALHQQGWPWKPVSRHLFCRWRKTARWFADSPTGAGNGKRSGWRLRYTNPKP